MGATEEATKAVGSFMDSMKSQPLSLALVILNVALMFLLYQVYTKADSAREAQMQLIFAAQKDMQVLLSKCVVPN